MDCKNGREIRRTHVIAEIINECMAIDTDFQKLFEIKAQALTDFAVALRYPGDFLFPSIEETKEAIDMAEKIKEFVLQKFKINGFDI